VKILRTPEELTPFHRGALVPTMGGLHKGHLTLARAASETGLPVVVSVFVNPKQFEEAADFDRYPRDVESDAAMLEPMGVSVVFAPSVDTVYPPGAPPSPVVVPPVADGPGLEDAYRPGHLAGVCQVLWRLFELARPAVAVFGEKDWQQLQLARAVAAQIADATNEPLDILPAPTVREPDGLAMSSRNANLSPQDRTSAAILPRAMREAIAAIESGGNVPAILDQLRAQLTKNGFASVDYATLADADSLEPLATTPASPARLLVAARIGQTRLIDNMHVAPGA